MTKTINCAECDVEFTFEENPKYPRKYCLNCSAKKKASFEGRDVEPPVVHEKPGAIAKPQNATAKTEYEIGLRRCRSNALASAIAYCPGNTLKDEEYITGIVDLAKKFEQYILTGE